MHDRPALAGRLPTLIANTVLGPDTGRDQSYQPSDMEIIFDKNHFHQRKQNHAGAAKAE